MANLRKRRPEPVTNGRSIAFYIETVLVVLMLFVVLSVVVQFFVKAHVATLESESRMAEVTTARQVAELFQSTDEPVQLAAALKGKWWTAENTTITADVEYVSGAPMQVSIVITPSATGAGTLYKAAITVKDPNSLQPYTLESEHYVQGGAQ